MNINELFRRCVLAEKNKNDIGKNAPEYISRDKRYCEVFCKYFLQKILKYSKLKLHDERCNKNCCDYVIEGTNIGVEVVQAIDPKFKEEESVWNKPLCKGESDNIYHRWKNQPVSFENILEVLNKKNKLYNRYIEENHGIIKEIELFIYCDTYIEINNNYLICYKSEYANKKSFDNIFLRMSKISYLGNLPYLVVGDLLKITIEELSNSINKYNKIFICFNNNYYIYEKNTMKSFIFNKDDFACISSLVVKDILN